MKVIFVRAMLAANEKLTFSGTCISSNSMENCVSF